MRKFMASVGFWANVAAAMLLVFANVAAAQGLENPLKYNSIAGLVEALLKALIAIAYPIIIFFVIYSGFLFISARGKPDELSRARRNFVYVAIGAVLILGAWILSTMISNTVSQLK